MIFHFYYLQYAVKNTVLHLWKGCFYIPSAKMAGMARQQNIPAGKSSQLPSVRDLLHPSYLPALYPVKRMKILLHGLHCRHYLKYHLVHVLYFLYPHGYPASVFQFL